MPLLYTCEFCTKPATVSVDLLDEEGFPVDWLSTCEKCKSLWNIGWRQVHFDGPLYPGAYAKALNAMSKAEADEAASDPWAVR